MEVYLKNLARRINQTEQAFIFTRAPISNHQHLELKQEERDGIEITKIHIDPRELVDFRTTYQRDEVDVIFRNYLLEKNPDIVHIHHLGGLSLGMIRVADELGIPVIITFHDHHPFCPRGQRIRDDKRICQKIILDECLECLKPQTVGLNLPAKLAMYFLAKEKGLELLREMHKEIKRQLERVFLIISPSKFHSERIIEVDAPREKVIVLPYGLDLSLVETVPARPKGAPVKKFGYLGTLIPSKGVEDLILAFRKMKYKDRELHIYGEAVPYHGLYDYDKRLKEMCYGLPVYFHGPYQPEELPRVLSEIDCVVLPSRWYESFGITIREAIRAKRPIIVSDIGAFREAVQHMENALLFPPGDVIALREMMERLVEKPELADKLVEKGIEVVGLDEHINQLKEIYLRAIDSKKEFRR